MAVVAVKSERITNRDATPVVLTPGRLAGAFAKQTAEIVTITSGDSVGSTYRTVEVPSNAVMKKVAVDSPDIGTTTAADIGLYRTTRDGGAVVDADFFASAVALNAGALTGDTNRMYESGVVTITNSVTPLWMILGLTSDPGVMYDVTLTLTGAADATGVLRLDVEFTT